MAQGVDQISPRDVEVLKRELAAEAAALRAKFGAARITTPPPPSPVILPQFAQGSGSSQRKLGFRELKASVYDFPILGYALKFWVTLARLPVRIKQLLDDIEATDERIGSMRRLVSEENAALMARHQALSARVELLTLAVDELRSRVDKQGAP